MKAFLMHKDRDFDPSRILMRRDRESRHSRGQDQALALNQMLPWNEQALRQDLGLDVLCSAMADGDRFLSEVALVGILTSLSDLPAITYRQHIVADCLQNAPIVRAMYQIAVDAIEAERKDHWSIFARYPSGILHRAVDVLQMFVGMLRRLRIIADQHAGEFVSEGFATLFAMLRHELADDYFAEIEEHLGRLKFRHGAVVSARLGNGNKGTDYVLRRPHQDSRNWVARWLSEKGPAYSFQLHPRDEAGARALAELNDRGVNLVANALAQSTDHILSFFEMLRTELGFYVGCINLHARLTELGEPMCFPQTASAGERRLSFLGLYDPALALSMQAKVVGNDVCADNCDAIIVTGANTGGKSTFLRSAGIAQLMMQAGMFVPAQRFSAELSEGVITHYKREEDASMESGKWAEELSRMSEIADRLRPNTLMLFNESFASTNEREGSEIAGQIVEALLASGVKVFYVTHLYHFARSRYTRKSERTTFLRAERRPDGSRPFRLVSGEPLQTSYGADLYRAIFSDDSPSLDGAGGRRTNLLPTLVMRGK
jgi:DNA mismatch repair ATPase MutS